MTYSSSSGSITATRARSQPHESIEGHNVRVDPAGYDYVLDWIDNRFVLVPKPAAFQKQGAEPMIDSARPLAVWLKT